MKSVDLLQEHATSLCACSTLSGVDATQAQGTHNDTDMQGTPSGHSATSAESKSPVSKQVAHRAKSPPGQGGAVHDTIPKLCVT